MKYKFLTDTHWYAPNEIEITEFDYDFANNNLYLLGDIFDLKNCKKSQVKIVRQHILDAKRAMGHRYLLDNHDAVFGKVSDPYHIPYSNIGICGGSQIFWDEDRLHSYTQKKFGAGFLKRQIWVRALMLASRFVSDNISDKAMSRAIIIAKDLGVKTIVCGHKHPKKIIRRTQDGITLIVLPRGYSELKL